MPTTQTPNRCLLCSVLLLSGVLRSAREHGLDVEELSSGEVRRRFPAFRVGEGFSAVFEPRAAHSFLQVHQLWQIEPLSLPAQMAHDREKIHGDLATCFYEKPPESLLSLRINCGRVLHPTPFESAVIFGLVGCRLRALVRCRPR